MRIATHELGPRPDLDPDDFDVFLSTDEEAPAPWVGLGAEAFRAAIETLEAVRKQQLVAARVACQVLQMTTSLNFDLALELESIAYSMLLASQGFKDWRARTPVRGRIEGEDPRVLISEEDGAIAIRLNRPAKRNAFDAAMRDALCDALQFALEDPDRRPVVLTGEGAAFSAGGDLDEFGTATDPGLAHLIRTQQSPARLAHRLGDRLTVRLHGACIGAGIEIPAAAARIVAAEGACFRLPEVAMGLIPGAGGTATIARRIGPRRAAYMALCGADIDLSTALRWGLVDGVA